MAARAHGPFRVTVFNANGIVRQRCELSKQLQVLRIDVALLSETHLKPHERFFILNCHIYWTDRFLNRKDGAAVTVRKGIPNNNVDLTLHVSVEATGVCIGIVNNEVLLAAVCKSPGHAWIDADIIELLSFRHKTILEGDLNAKHPCWISAFSNPSGKKLLDLFDVNEFEISAPQCPSHYCPTGNGDILDIVVHHVYQIVTYDHF
jgi:hypothetical protein